MDANTRLLVISPHADDAELGCGGYMYHVAKAGGRVLNVVCAVGNVYFEHLGRIVNWHERVAELEASSAVLGVEWSLFYDSADCKLDQIPTVDFVRRIEAVVADFSPTVVLVPLPSSHQDHEAAYRACVAAFRPSRGLSGVCLIAAYEYPATSWGSGAAAGVGRGGMYAEIGATGLQKKIEALSCYRTQVRDDAHCWSLDAARTMARMRALESGLNQAELFYVMRKIERCAS